MMSCCQCEGLERQFDRETARKDLRRFRRRGPIRTTRLLVEALESEGVDHASLLDVGGGVGAIHHLLLDAGAAEAVHVDVSPAYLEAAREEAERRAHGDRVRFVRGDVVALASELPPEDIVTLDRVICCYPDMELLVGRTAAKARRAYGAVYPRDAWWMRSAVALINMLMRARRSAFRVFVHPPARIDAQLRHGGFERRSLDRTLLWEVAVYHRTAGAAV